MTFADLGILRDDGKVECACGKAIEKNRFAPHARGCDDFTDGDGA